MRRSTYKNKLIYCCTLCVFIPCIIFSSIAMLFYYGTQKRTILENMEALVQEVETAWENQEKNYRKLGSFFAQTEELIRYFSKDYLSEEEYGELFKIVEPTMNRIVNTNQDILNDVLVFSANEQICQSEKQIFYMEVLEGFGYGQAFLESDEKYQIYYDDSGVWSSMLRQSKMEDVEDAYIFLEKFFHINGKQMCVLAFVITPERLWEGNHALELSDGYVLLQGEQILKSKKLDMSMEKLVQSKEWKYSAIESTGTEYYLKMDFSTLNVLKGTIILLYMTVFLAIVLITYFINQMINRMFGRLNTVINSMNQIKLGDFRQYLAEEETEDEVGNIIRQFNYLLLQLEHNAEKILQREREKKDAEILALQYQMNPHFLCNSLNIIQLAVEEKGCYEISDAIASFVEVLRYNISGGMDSTVQEELDSIREYIQFISFCRNVEIHTDIQVPKEWRQSYLMKYLLQPIVENAVYHGYDRYTKQVGLQIRLYQEEDFLHLEIANDGNQMKTEKLEQLNEKLKAPAEKLARDKHQRVGLFNIAYRMKLRFGPEVRVYMTSETGKTVFHLCYPALRTEKGDSYEGFDRR